MSDEYLFSPVMSVDAVDECAPTERDPSLHGVERLHAASR